MAAIDALVLFQDHWGTFDTFKQLVQTCKTLRSPLLEKLKRQKVKFVNVVPKKNLGEFTMHHQKLHPEVLKLIDKKYHKFALAPDGRPHGTSRRWYDDKLAAEATYFWGRAVIQKTYYYTKENTSITLQNFETGVRTVYLNGKITCMKTPTKTTIYNDDDRITIHFDVNHLKTAKLVHKRIDGKWCIQDTEKFENGKFVFHKNSEMEFRVVLENGLQKTVFTKDDSSTRTWKDGDKSVRKDYQKNVLVRRTTVEGDIRITELFGKIRKHITSCKGKLVKELSLKQTGDKWVVFKQVAPGHVEKHFVGHNKPHHLHNQWKPREALISCMVVTYYRNGQSEPFYEVDNHGGRYRPWPNDQKVVKVVAKPSSLTNVIL
jgi:hypothetical protein